MRLLTAALVLACAAPVLAQRPAAQRAVRPAQRAAASPLVMERLAALDPAGRLSASLVAADGTLRRLDGALPLQGATLDERAADFLARFAPLFGAEAVRFGAPRPLQPRADRTPRALRLPQTVHGWPVDGAGLVLALDAAGRATGASGFVSAEAAELPAPVVGAEQARDAVLAHLGLDLAALRGAPRVAGAVRLRETPALVQRVRLVVRDGLLPLVADVDAQSGAVLSVADDRTDAQGNIVLDGQKLGFDLVSGSGLAYATIGAAINRTESVQGLSALTITTIDADLSLFPGTLTGRYATVSDLVGVINSPLLIFDFPDTSITPLDPQNPGLLKGEAFDHVNTYLWLTRTAKNLTKITGTLPSDTCIPVIVNFDNGGAGFPNAYFTPAPLDDPAPGDPHFAPGTLVFGDYDVVSDDLMDDFSRDPTVVSHEYFHALAFFAGLSFGEDAEHKDTPQRAVNEAIADYGSATIHKTPLIGKALVKHIGPDLGLDGEELRDLSAPVTLPDNLLDTLGQTGLPEEHEAGKIFGAALWRLRTLAKPAVANDLIINTLGTWPQSAADVGFPDVTPGNAEAAYEAYDFACFLAIANAALQAPGAKGWKQTSKVLGAFLAHGITGQTAGTIAELPTSTEKLTLNFASEFLGTIDHHTFNLVVAAGQKLTITLTGNSKDDTKADFSFLAGEELLSFPNEKVINDAGTKASQKGIVVEAPGVLTLDLFSSSAPGRYKVDIKLTAPPN
jgi:hypothetical protein